MSMTYEAMDYAKNNMTAHEMAEYLFINYPDYAEELAEEIKARMYLELMNENKYPTLFDKEAVNELYETV